MKREPKVKPVRAWAILVTMGNGLAESPYSTRFWIYRSKQEAQLFHAHMPKIRVEIRPAPKRRKARKVKR